jgi:hypothetical protein
MRMAQQRLLVLQLLRFRYEGAAVAARPTNKARGHVVAEQRNVCTLDAACNWLLLGDRRIGDDGTAPTFVLELVGRFVTGLSFSSCILGISPKSLPRPFLRKIAARCAQFRKGANTWRRSARAQATSALAAGRELIDQEADVEAVSWQLRLAILKDAKLDVSKVPAK